ncbi:ras association domain-containing protein 7 isoform X3 [Hippopotamus amphibius kiboko]|uniref:ras association domain-containing protein 7 isoform X3 n=1 Tax=Hippopotamus amphibius kiboko TaxID=575201 RepID=UPI00259265E9|nr:ras association domain-containing protein 7 isoform X3 [Hippopotamus amphibius kiboko]
MGGSGEAQGAGDRRGRGLRADARGRGCALRARTGMLSGLAVMELKVWVDGIQRVVCGVSEQTTCQEVVIALAQAIGQTGRFVLVQRLREKERQLLPQECPVGAQATCGQFASDVQFVLRRTGPSLAGRPSSDSCPPPERCSVRASLPPKPRPALDCEPRKALTFSLGFPGLAPGPVPPEPVAPVAPLPGCCADLQGLERRVHRNAAELGQEAFWEQELRREQAREREGQARLQALSAATAEHAARLQALDAQARALEAELLLAAEAPGPSSPAASVAERLRQDLATQERQSVEVQGSLALVGRALEAAEHALQDLLPPAREEPLTGAPQNPALVSSLSQESMSVSSTLGGMRSSCGPLSPLSPCLPHSCPHEAELLEVAALAPEWTSTASPALGSADASKGSQGQPSLDKGRRARGHRGLLPPCKGKPWCPGSEMGRLGTLGCLLQGAEEG